MYVGLKDWQHEKDVLKSLNDSTNLEEYGESYYESFTGSSHNEEEEGVKDWQHENDEIKSLLDGIYERRSTNLDEYGESYSESSTGSSYSEEEEEEELKECREFVNLVGITSVDSYELRRLESPSIDGYRKKKRFRTDPDEPEKKFQAKEEDLVTEDDEDRPTIRVMGDPSTGAYVDVMIENYVYVSYFQHKGTDKRYRLNLHDLAKKLLPFGAQYSKNKFTKVTLKYTGGPSHYFFESGAKVESGTYSPVIARKKHNNSMRILTEFCGYTELEVSKRKCENIVAKGILPFGIRLPLLKARYPSFVQYTDRFAGAIIRIGQLDEYNASRSFSKPKHSESSGDDYDIPDEFLDEDDLNSEDEDEDSYEYFEELNEDKFYNRGYEQDDTDIKKEKKEMFMFDETYELEDQLLSLKKPKKITILVFQKGRIICAGCKSRNSILKSYGKVIDILYSCRDCPVNIAAESELV